MCSGVLLLHVSILLFLFSSDFQSHLLTLPQNPVIEIGTNFTATCLISNTVEVTADDLYWKLSNVTIPRDQYRKVNSTALSVTVPITKDISEEWLFCYCRKKSSYVVLNEGKFIHGISLGTGCEFSLLHFNIIIANINAGCEIMSGQALCARRVSTIYDHEYQRGCRRVSDAVLLFSVVPDRPEKPENLSCISFQKEDKSFPSLQCSWGTTRRQTPTVPVHFTLKVMQVLR